MHLGLLTNIKIKDIFSQSLVNGLCFFSSGLLIKSEINICFLHCFNAVGWAAGRASGL